MANVIKLRKGLDINLKGKANNELVTVEHGSRFALCPDDFTGVTPKVVVKEGDSVRAGDALFVDKNHPTVKFVSPVSGKVALVERGERRKVLSVQVEADKEQQFVDFGRHDVAKMTCKEMTDVLSEAGMMAFIKQRPYDVTANVEDLPKSIFVTAFNSMPLAADFEVALKGQEEAFQAGLDALTCVATVYLGISAKQTSQALTGAKNVTVTVFDGPAPAGNVGVQINHVEPVNKGDIVWTLSGEEVIFIGRLMLTGKVDFTRSVALAGSQVKSPAYSNMIVGQRISTLTDGRLLEGNNRIINGNVLTGTKVSADGFLAAHATEVNVIPEGDDVHELFGWIMPRFKDFSTSRSYFSWLLGKKHEYVLDARVKGGERHIIMSNEYDRVFPMDIYPEYLIKAIIAGDIDKMEQLGIYEVAPEDFALCEFVDTSKLELQRIVRQGLDMLRKEN